MIHGSCPTCARSYTIAALRDLPSFPFCSPRCRLIDLGRWIDGVNRLPGPELASADESDAGAAAESDDEAAAR